jgi:hypothetical protein
MLYLSIASLAGIGVAFLLRNEHRLTKIETKVDLILHHLGLNPGEKKDAAKS